MKYFHLSGNTYFILSIQWYTFFFQISHNLKMSLTSSPVNGTVIVLEKKKKKKKKESTFELPAYKLNYDGQIKIHERWISCTFLIIKIGVNKIVFIISYDDSYLRKMFCFE